VAALPEDAPAWQMRLALEHRRQPWDATAACVGWVGGGAEHLRLTARVKGPVADRA